MRQGLSHARAQSAGRSCTPFGARGSGAPSPFYSGSRSGGECVPASTNVRCSSCSTAAQAARLPGSRRSSTWLSCRRRRVVTCRTTRRPEPVSSSVTTLRLSGSMPRTKCPDACNRSASRVTEEPATSRASAHCVELARPSPCNSSRRRYWGSDTSRCSTLRRATPTRSRVATSKANNSSVDVFDGSPRPTARVWHGHGAFWRIQRAPPG